MSIYRSLVCSAPLAQAHMFLRSKLKHSPKIATKLPPNFPNFPNFSATLIEIDITNIILDRNLKKSSKNTTKYRKYEKSVLRKKGQSYQTFAQCLLDPEYSVKILAGNLPQ